MLSSAIIIGRSHRLTHQNCHDFAITGMPTANSAFGLVLDGCGSKFWMNGRATPSHNEIGANLLGTFTAGYLHEQLAMNNDQSLDGLLLDLYLNCLCFLEGLVGSLAFSHTASRREFIATRLLCTLVGFIKREKTAVFFWLGDGYLCHDGIITPLDSANQPDYLAYRLLGESVSDQFNLIFVPQPDEIEWLAVATDGWRADHLAQLDQPMNDLTLQRRLNVIARQRGSFEDDGGTAVWWREDRHSIS